MRSPRASPRRRHRTARRGGRPHRTVRGRPGATDPSGAYGGLYQFDARTWRDLGGAGRPQDAPPAEQTYRAERLYARSGAAAWPHCGARLRG